MTTVFDKQKLSSLEGVDLSRKGSIDEPILDLTKLINSHSDLFTLSSCSGRIVILRESSESEESGVRKAGCDWLMVSHDVLDPDQALLSLADRDAAVPGCVVIKFEPLVLHVQVDKTVSCQRIIQFPVTVSHSGGGEVTVSRSVSVWLQKLRSDSEQDWQDSDCSQVNTWSRGSRH